MPYGIKIKTEVVGNPSFFAIEWSYYSITEDERLLCGDVSYIANNQRIESEGCIINWTVCGLQQDFEAFRLGKREPIPSLPIDFSDVRMEDAFFCLYRGTYSGDEQPSDDYCVCPKEYFDFYSRCKKLMMEHYFAGKMPYCTEEEIQESLGMGDDYSEDYLLGSWVKGCYMVNDLAADGLLHWAIYLVPDIAKNQERLIWRKFSKYNEETGTHTHFPISEAILPVGYFWKVHEEFMNEAAKEMEQVLQEMGKQQ